MANDSEARIIVGGKTTNFAGLMPGILEEALYHLEVEKPLYIVGGFGGAAHDLATVLVRTNSSIPDSLLEEKREGNVELGVLIDGYPSDTDDSFPHDVSRQDAKKSYHRLWAQIKRIQKVGLEDGLRNGLSDDDNAKLMVSEDTKLVVDLILKGLQCVMS